MAATRFPPRFFKVFISHFSSDAMVIPVSYYDQLPSHLPKTAILQGHRGCWNVAMMYKRDEVYFGQGWTKFVEDNSLSDGDFLTFVYNGDRVFEVSIYGPDGCKETRALVEAEDDNENSVSSISSKDTHTGSESEMPNTIPRSKNKGKRSEEAEDSDDKEDSVYSGSSEHTDTDTCSEFKMANAIPKSRNKAKAKEEVSDEDSDSEYIEAFGRLDFSENSESDCSYSPVIKQKPKKKGKSKLIEDEEASDDSLEREAGKRARKIKAKIKNPEAYLDDPNNVYFETAVKNRKYELLVPAQLVKECCLKFESRINYIDEFGKIETKTAKWGDQRVCIKTWIRICERNKLKKEDRILCELLRKRDLVYAIKLHIVRGKDL